MGHSDGSIDISLPKHRRLVRYTDVKERQSGVITFDVVIKVSMIRFKVVPSYSRDFHNCPIISDLLIESLIDVIVKPSLQVTMLLATTEVIIVQTEAIVSYVPKISFLFGKVLILSGTTKAVFWQKLFG